MCTSRFSTWACAAKQAAKATPSARTVDLMVFLLRSGNLLDFSPFQQRLRDGASVDVFQLAAKRDAARNAADTDAARAQHLGDVMGGGFAFVGEIGSEDHLLDLARRRPLEQPLEPDVA